jgi:hypothetical protein
VALKDALGVMHTAVSEVTSESEQNMAADELKSAIDELTKLRDELASSSSEPIDENEEVEQPGITRAIEAAIDRLNEEVVNVGASAVRELHRVGEAAIEALRRLEVNGNKNGPGAGRASKQEARKGARTRAKKR